MGLSCPTVTSIVSGVFAFGRVRVKVTRVPTGRSFRDIKLRLFSCGLSPSEFLINIEDFSGISRKIFAGSAV